MVKASRHATWVIYATGFVIHRSVRVVVGSDDVSMAEYDANTGVLKGAPNAWGFGIAYPSQAPDGVHFDVGISSFLEHFYRQIPTIMAHL